MRDPYVGQETAVLILKGVTIMKKLHLTVFVTSIGDTSIWVPDDMDRETAIKYAHQHMNEVALPRNLDPDGNSMVLDEENCDFEDADKCDISDGKDDPDVGKQPWQTCREAGYCTVLGKNSNPTVFDCDKFCPNRPR